MCAYLPPPNGTIHFGYSVWIGKVGPVWPTTRTTTMTDNGDEGTRDKRDSGIYLPILIHGTCWWLVNSDQWQQQQQQRLNQGSAKDERGAVMGTQGEYVPLIRLPRQLTTMTPTSTNSPTQTNNDMDKLRTTTTRTSTTTTTTTTMATWTSREETSMVLISLDYDMEDRPGWDKHWAHLDYTHSGHLKDIQQPQ